MPDYSGHLTGDISGEGLPYSLGRRGVADHMVIQEIKREHYHHCFTCGTIVPESALNQHHEMHVVAELKGKRNTMSQVSWCDEGEHAFKAGAPGSVDYSATVTDENGRRQTVVRDACADHSPFQPKEVKQLKAIEAELTEEYTPRNYL